MVAPIELLTDLQNYILSHRAESTGLTYRNLEVSFRISMVARTSMVIEVKKLPSFELEVKEIQVSILDSDANQSLKYSILRV